MTTTTTIDRLTAGPPPPCYSKDVEWGIKDIMENPEKCRQKEGLNCGTDGKY